MLRHATTGASRTGPGRPRPIGGNPWIVSAGSVAADLVPFAQWWRPDLVITDPMAYAGPLTAEVLGVPLVRVLWGPDWPSSGFGMGGFTAGQTSSWWPPELVTLYESYGARTAVDFAQFTIDPFPPSLQLPGLVNRVSMRQVPYNGSGPVPGWLTEPVRRPRLCVTWGTSTSEFVGEDAFLVPELLASLADLDVEVVLAVGSGDADRLDVIPANVRVAENLPLDALLPSCAALVNQGGASTVVTAAVHGVPQVVIPQFADQPVNARLIAEAGAGVALDSQPLDPAQVRAAMTSVLFDPSMRAAAQRIRAEIQAAPSPAEIVPMIEALVGAQNREQGRKAS
jgi:UDP:flavonoid glycosyltransferase YjiC (YdhE family)